MSLRKFTAILRLTPSLMVGYFTWIRPYSNHPEKYPLEKRYKRFKKFAEHAMKVMKPDMQVHHLEYINNHEQPFVGIANHRFFMDPFFIATFCDKPVSFIAKKEVEKLPFVGRVLKAIDGYFIDREDVMGQVKLFKTIAERMKKGDISYFIFPEGTRMKNKEQLQTLPYKDGSLKLAYWANLDVIYVAHLGTERIFDKPFPGHKRANITFEIFPPIKNADLIDKSTTEVMPMIEKMTNDIIRKLDTENQTRGNK